MRIFLTGGTGYIGSAVLDALVKAGHQVDALVRNSEKAAEVQARLQQIPSLEGVRWAVLESSGKISFIPR